MLSRSNAEAWFALWLLAWGASPLVAQDTPAASAAPKADAQVTQRDRLWQEIVKAENEDKLDESVRLIRQVVPLDRKLISEKPQQLADTLERLARTEILRDDLVAAREAADECLKTSVSRLGQNHWQVKRSESLLDGIGRLSKAPTERRRKAAELARKCNLLGRQERYSEAVDVVEQLRTVDATIFGTQHPAYAEVLYTLGVALLQLDRTAEGAGMIEQARAIFEKRYGVEHPDTARAWFAEAVAFEQRNDVQRAEAGYLRAAETFQKTVGPEHPDCRMAINCLMAFLEKRAGEAFDREDYLEAREAWTKVADWKSVLVGSEHPEVKDARLEVANAELWSRLVPEERRQLRDARGTRDRAVQLADQGSYAEAIRLGEQFVNVYKKILGANHPDYAVGVDGLGWLYFLQGDDVRAASLLRQALEIRTRILGKNHPDYAVSLRHVACLYLRQGDYDQADMFLRAAMKVQEKTSGKNNLEVVWSLNSLGFLYLAQGDFARAEPLLQQAMEIAKKFFGEDQLVYDSVLCSLALLYAGQGDYARAEPLLRQASEIVKRNCGENHPDFATSLHNLAMLYVDHGDFAQAEPLFRQALEIQERTIGEDALDYAAGLRGLARLYTDQGDYARAEPLLRRAVATVRRQNEAASVIQSARQQLATLSTSRRFLDSFLFVSVRKNGSAETVYQEMLTWKGVALQRARQTRVIGRSQELAPVFGELQRVAGILANTAGTPDTKAPTEWVKRVAELWAVKEALEAELSWRSAAYRQVTKQVTVNELKAALPQGAVLVDLLVCLFPPGKEKKTENRGERHLLACLVSTSHNLELVDLGAVETIEKAVEMWRGDYGMTATSAAAGRLLRERIWEPLASRLRDAKLVLVSPDGPIARMPLGALPGQQPGTYLIEEKMIALIPVPRAIPELINETDQHQLPNGLLLVGDVDYDCGSGTPAKANEQDGAGVLKIVPSGAWTHFRRLPGFQQELATIKRLYERAFVPPAVTSLDGDRATKEVFREEAVRHGFLHLATHGFFAPDEMRSALAANPEDGGYLEWTRKRRPLTGLLPGLLSGLALAGANREANAGEDNGILTAEEIGAMNLDGVQLVTLSACETGLGARAGGEGLLGLQRAFQVAGARTVVASLWSVDDNATRTLMTEFYKNLWERKLGKLESLRQAQLSMLRSYDPKAGQLRGPGVMTAVDPAKLANAPAASSSSREPLSPMYWAAFVLSGDWR